MSGEHEAPASTPRSVTIALDRRLRLVSPQQLPLVPRAVLRAVAGRAEEHALAWPNLETIAFEAGTTPNTARRALDELIRLGWLTVTVQATPRRSATYRVNLEPVAPEAGITERYPRGAAPRDHGATSQGSRSDIPGITEMDPRDHAPTPRDHGAAPEDHIEGHREDPTEDHRPQIAHARDGREGGLREGLLFADLEAPPAAAAKKPAKKPSRPKVKPATAAPAVRERPAAERYLEAYVQGLADAGHAITPPPASDGKRLGAACAVHAREGGVPVVGAELLVWIRTTAAQFRRAVSRPEVHRGGLTVHGFIAWLDNGRPVQPPTFRARAEADDFARPQDSDSWPEAQLVPPAEYVPPPPRSAEMPPNIQAEVDELAKLSPAELERRIQNARGFAGYGAL